MSSARHSRARTGTAEIGSRERRRAERRKRKARGPRPDQETPAAAEDGGGDAPVESRSERKNREAREALEPLHDYERPPVVTLGAVVSALLAASIVTAYVAGAKVSGDRPPIAQVIVPTLLMGVMAWGMWRARYWAVLGFQVVVLILIIATALGTVQATSVVQVIGNFVVLAVSGAFFFFLVKALARIQMPDRLPRD